MSFFSDWSPDGGRIAFDFADGTSEHLATMDPNGRHVRQLTFGKGIQEVPKWSPDGRWITFDASPDFPDEPGFHTDIWTMRADGTGARQLTSGAFDVEPVFSPDGRRIAFGRITGVDAQGFQLEAVYVINTDGTHLREVVPPLADLEHPDWSPDGAWISFNIAPEHDDRQIRRVAIWVVVRPRPVSFTNVQTTNLTCAAATCEPARTRQGQALRFRSRRQQMMAQARLRNASWMSSRISQRIRSRRNQCSSARDCSTTQRCTPSPEPCPVPRRAITGVMPLARTCRRYLSWS